jgi:hypothetical protein
MLRARDRGKHRGHWDPDHPDPATGYRPASPPGAARHLHQALPDYRGHPVRRHGPAAKPTELSRTPALAATSGQEPGHH